MKTSPDTRTDARQTLVPAPSAFSPNRNARRDFDGPALDELATSENASAILQAAAANREREDKGAQLEKLAFNFCKAATIMLLTLPLGRFAFPFVAGIAALFFALAHVYGQKETRCMVQKPLVVAAFWSFVCISSLLVLLHPWISAASK